MGPFTNVTSQNRMNKFKDLLQCQDLSLSFPSLKDLPTLKMILVDNSNAFIPGEIRVAQRNNLVFHFEIWTEAEQKIFTAKANRIQMFQFGE